ncbi:hypothetical protein FKM82_008785 [Ascaphus truei]
MPSSPGATIFFLGYIWRHTASSVADLPLGPGLGRQNLGVAYFPCFMTSQSSGSPPPTSLDWRRRLHERGLLQATAQYGNNITILT